MKLPIKTNLIVTSLILFLSVFFVSGFLSPANAAKKDRAPKPLEISVNAPNGGETYNVSDEVRIEWSSSRSIDKVSIGYKSCPSCLDWIAFNIENPKKNKIYDWIIPENLNSGDYEIYIIGYDTGVGSVTDVSDSPFTINGVEEPEPEPLTVAITSPNGGEEIEVGSTYTITWDSSSVMDKVTLGYKTCPSCLDWIVNNIPNTNSYDWTVPEHLNEGDYQIYIIAYDTGVGSVTDVSDAVFSIVAPEPEPEPLTVAITSPNGGEEYEVGSTYTITWDSSSVIDQVTLGYKTCPSCLDWIVNNIPNTNSYEWTVPEYLNAGDYQIYIIAYDTGVGSVTDVSDAAFSITKPIPVVTVVADAIEPSSGPTGALVTLTGSSFGPTEGMVIFSTASSDYGGVTQFWSDTQISVLVPGMIAGDGNVDVKVRTSENELSNTLVYNVTSSQPRIDDITPELAKVGEFISIEGTNFGSGGAVKFYSDGNLVSTVTAPDWNNDLVNVQLPAGLTNGLEYAVQIAKTEGPVSSVVFYLLGL